ncbi:MAG TPA: TauD/TfdA family dioxygenase [Alphaproteobacteria bacterium]|nr:TauD/TfdA family dioxygenase [Alphaproteobacteria bacterium]
MSYTVLPLHPIFAAELKGADLREPPSPELVRIVNEAMAEYAVLVIRDQKITDEQHIRFTRAFGPLELMPDLGSKQHKGGRVLPEMYDASNLDENGEIVGPDSQRASFNKGNELFHSDSSYNDLPTKWSLLMGHTVPPEGGNTEFVDMRAVYDALSDDMKAKIENLMVEHYIWHSRRKGGLTGITPEMEAAMPPVHHPLVRLSENGRKALYMGGHASHIVGWPIEEGRKFLDELYAFATQSQFIYSHKWQTGDMLIWDNRCTMHRGTPFPYFKYKRDLRATRMLESGPDRSSTTARQMAQAGT